MTTKSSLLDKCVGKPVDMAGLVAYADDSVVSKRILDKSIGTITLFAFDKGQRLSTHSAPYDAVVEVVEGTARIAIADEEFDVAAGQIVIMPANIPHSVTANERFKMLLTMVREKE